MQRIFGLIALAIFTSVALFTPKEDKTIVKKHTGNTHVVQSTGASMVQVVRIIDGDTIEVLQADTKKEIVRIIGIDTPELGGHGTVEQCYAKEATEYIRSLINTKNVELYAQVGDNADKYGRLLRYVQFNGEDIGLRMILEGYARNYPWFDHDRIEEYTSAEGKAQYNKIGLWKACEH